MEHLVHRTLCDCTSQEFAEASRLIFRDFALPPPAHYDGAAFERRFGFEHLDRTASRFVTTATGPVAAILIARRGRVAHISGFGVSPDHRRQGIARALLSTVCDEAQRRGDTRVLVEVPATAHPALALYSSLGFRPLRRLVGFVRDTHTGGTADGLVEIEPHVVADAVAREGADDLPWFFHPSSLAGTALPTRAYHLEHQAFAIVTPRNGDVNLRALFVRTAARRQGLGRRMVDAIVARHRATTCSVVPLVPVGLGCAFFAATAFRDAGISHDEMERVL